jgi:NADP-dependent 3-hydroxy acid dehydrogenase YdfG
MQTAVITGAGSGIGAALALTLARRGMRVVCADIDERAVASVAREIRMLGREATSVRADVTVPADLDALATDDVDLWINNAGIAIGGATHELGLDDWRRVVDVNLMGVVHGVHAIYPRMVRRGSGHIVNIASVAGLAPYPLALPYTTTKHAVVGLSSRCAPRHVHMECESASHVPAASTRRSGSAPTCAARSGRSARVCSPACRSRRRRVGARRRSPTASRAIAPSFR